MKYIILIFILLIVSLTVKCIHLYINTKNQEYKNWVKNCTLEQYNNFKNYNEYREKMAMCEDNKKYNLYMEVMEELKNDSDISKEWFNDDNLEDDYDNISKY